MFHQCETTEVFFNTVHQVKFILLLLTITLKLYALVPDTLVVKKDSLASKGSLFIIPFLSYQQETSWAPGFAYGCYFKSKDISRISSVSGSISYTFLNQSIINVTPKIFLGNNKWYLYSNFNLRNYPDLYFGIGNQPNNTILSYTNRNISLTLQPQYIISKTFFVGMELGFNANNVKVDPENERKMLDAVALYGVSGWEPYHITSVGLTAAYDNRDNQFHPQQGGFSKLVISGSKAGNLSSYSYLATTLDIRKYWRIATNHVLACQLYYDHILGQGDVPFQTLGTIGGRDLFRGFRQGMYRDKIMYVLQTEYRFPIYKRLKGSVFASTGDVLNTENARITPLKVAFGGGLRFRLNDARVHLRLDVAQNNFGDKLQVYITATEAF